MNLPSVINTPGGIARFSREVREALVALQRRGTGPTIARQSPDTHPFALYAWYDAAEEETYLQANYGALTVHNYGESAGDWNPQSRDYAVRSGSSTGAILGLGGDKPKLTLSSESTYGVWVVLTLTDSSASVVGEGVWNFIRGQPDPYLLVSTAATGLVSSDSLGLSGKHHAWYIGQVVVNSAGYPLVTQHRKSDISWTGCAWFEPDPPEEEP